jgi:hypothetical protein
MTFKAAGNPCDLDRENILLNSGSYSTTANIDSDVFRERAITCGMPTRLSHVPDATAYTAGTPPLTDSWLSRCRWGWSPANKASDGQAGSLV